MPISGQGISSRRLSATGRTAPYPAFANSSSVGSISFPLQSATVSILLSFSSLNDSAKTTQLLLDSLVPSIQVIDSQHFGSTFGRQSRQNESRAGTQVRGHHRSARQAVAAGYDDPVALHADIRSHAAQLLHMHKPALEHRFRDDARAFSHGHQRDHLRLHVGGKPGKRQRTDVNAFQPGGLRRIDVDAFFFDAYRYAGLTKLVQQWFKMLRTASLD